MKKFAGIITLFVSSSTLFCCALPALLVSLGFGATLAGLVSRFPQWVWLSERKIALFVIAGVLLTIHGIWQKLARNRACPPDPNLAQACKSTQKVSAKLYWLSVVIYLIGFTFAFILPKIFENL